MKNQWVNCLCGLLCTVSAISCTSYKNAAYFQDFDAASIKTSVKPANFKSPVIQPDDILSVTIQTIDNDINAILNSSNAAAQAVATSTAGIQQTITGYLVDKNGEIELPFAGKIKIQSLTTVEAKEHIRKEISKYVKDPIVNVKFSNFKITVLGEVARPATYIVPNEKVGLLDALGLAGDLTMYGRRENVVLIRDSANGEKNMIHLNLNSKDIISSPYYYLQPNDVIYVEPNKYKVASIDAIRNRNITLIASALSVLLVAATQIK